MSLKENFYLKIFHEKYLFDSSNLNITNAENILLTFSHLQELISVNIDQLANILGYTLKQQFAEQKHLSNKKINNSTKDILKELKSKENQFKEEIKETKNYEFSQKQNILKPQKNSFSDYLIKNNFDFETKICSNNEENIVSQKKKRIVGMNKEERNYYDGIDCFQCIKVL
jgi:hypothetical protein